MAVQLVMDHSGDTRHWYDATNERSLLEARERFRELSERGYTAAVRVAGGSSRIVRSFEPTAEETLFFPRLVGGSRNLYEFLAALTHCLGMVS
jgi:hypothetical protein